MAIKPYINNYLHPDSNCGICMQRSTNPKDGCHRVCLHCPSPAKAPAGCSAPRLPCSSMLLDALGSELLSFWFQKKDNYLSGSKVRGRMEYPQSHLSAFQGNSCTSMKYIKKENIEKKFEKGRKFCAT